jgi:hypothetical protein
MSALAEALVAAQAELPTAIPRDSQGAGYRYTSLDALIAATRPILNKHGLAITQWPCTIRGEDGGLRPALRTRLQCTGPQPEKQLGWESVEDVMPLYVTDKTMQGLGAAITYARRYAWAAALGIASEEDTDSVTFADDVPFGEGPYS